MDQQIIIRGAREHNLKNISLAIPRNQFVVITGLSGSGKSSLAFDTIYAEGQRRYLESLSAYARQFLEQMQKPDVDSIDGLSPSISIEQKNISRNPRSTVGTVTESYDYLRLLFARLGTPYCPDCHRKIESQTIEQIVDKIMLGARDAKFSILSPIARGKKGEYQKELLDLRSQGFVRAKIDGKDTDLSVPIKLKKNLKHDISVYIDRLILKAGIEPRLAEALELAVKLSKGLAEVEMLGDAIPQIYSTKFACIDCGISFSEIEPRTFSFNSPHGACQRCGGIGTEAVFEPSLIIPDHHLSLVTGAIFPWSQKSRAWLERTLQPFCREFDLTSAVCFADLSRKAKQCLLYGTNGDVHGASGPAGRFRGVIALLTEELSANNDPWHDSELLAYVRYEKCSLCLGARLRQEALSVRVGSKTIAEICELDIDEARDFIAGLKFSHYEELIADPILKELQARLRFLSNVGLNYLTLSRSATSLSGGEAQRIRLATQIGSNLVGVLYVLDEPSIGLHQRDNEKLIQTLKELRDIGNSVIVVEHDEETIRQADTVIDLGPGAGEKGGHLVFIGGAKELQRQDQSLTGQYLSGKLTVPIPRVRRPKSRHRVLSLQGAHTHNLKNIDVHFPLGNFICITGVSGSGKSSLIIDTLLVALQDHFNRRDVSLSAVRDIRGLEHVDKIVHVDQSPIGRTPRSNPATYTGLFTEIRALFSALAEAKVRGYTAGRFSFNVPGGRCEACGGDGTKRISMHFLPDVFVTCEVCHAKRYNRETLEVYYRAKNISDVLSMTVEEALLFFERVPQLKTKLKTLHDVGLGYIQLGQSATTLSGGEAQRIKLARELSKRATGKTIYVLDEPTTGLHFEDIRRLLEILQILVDQGNTVIVIEHHLDVIKQADHVIDLGPEGGNAGGFLVFAGTPEQLTQCQESHTGKFLRNVLANAPDKSPV